MRLLLSCWALALSLALAGCSPAGRVFVDPAMRSAQGEAVDRPDASPETYRVILVGDAGSAGTDGFDPLLQTLRQHVHAAGPNSLTVFLGDNVYPNGLPPAGDPGRAEAEARLRSQIAVVEGAPGRALFVPGNHDWRESQPGGLEQVRRQEAFVEAALGPGTFLPSAGFPGPIAVDLTDDLRLLAIDTEWWLGSYARAEGDDPEAGAFFGDDNDFLLALADAVQNAGDRRLLVVGHHPILSNGDNAGIMPPERHLFPLLGMSDRAYVPLPLVGSLSIAMKRFAGVDHGDAGHPRNRALRTALWEAFAQHDGLVYAAGHDHSLQYFALPDGRSTLRQIVSGSGSEAEYVVPRNTLFAASHRGFFTLTYYDDGSARLDAIAVADGRPMGDTLATAWVLDPTPEVRAEPIGPTGPAPALPEAATAPVAPRYDEAGPLTRALVGDGYRRTWATPVTAPVLDLGREAGGLRPVRLGGGGQTVSLRLAGADGREYALRSIEKAPANPYGLGLTFGLPHAVAADASSSGMYPFGALVAARLARAAGLYHTDPRIVYVPDDPRLDPFRETVRDRVMLLEEHPDGPGVGRPHFGHAKNLVGPAKLYRELDADADHLVDAPFYLRARLLDVFLGDWDRHRDQWRWAAFEPGTLDPTLTGEDSTRGKVYRPVARDRDWALNDRDGLVFRLARPFLPKLQGLQPRYVNVGGLTESGREQDRRFLAPLDRAGWRRAAEDLQRTLTDAALAEAVDALPAEVRPLDRARLLSGLTARRDRLVSAAMAFYDGLNDVADVVGSHDDEVFELAWQDDGGLHLTVRKRRADGTAGRRLWDRAFDPDETREVRVWARGGEDRIEVSGVVRRPRIKLRVLPGAGTDAVEDRTGGEALYVYEGGSEDAFVAERLGPAAEIDRTNRIPHSAFGYVPAVQTRRRPVVTAAYNADDGLLLGGGLEVVHPGFGRDPYLRRHRLTAAIATVTGGGYARYAGSFPDAVGRLDLGLEASAQTPLASRNFFGFGSGAPLLPDVPGTYYRVRLAEVRVEPFAERRVEGGIRGWLGPSVSYVRPEVDSARFVGRAELPARDLAAQAFVGVNGGVTVDGVDRPLNPTQGARFDLRARGRLGVLDGGHAYLALGSSLTLYFSPTALRRVTLAVRGGGEHRFGSFPFYDAATLGGASILRGYRADRYAGRSVAYLDVEPRLRLRRFRALLAPYGEVGVLGFSDTGRVWADGEAAGRWRHGIGGGLWLSLAERATGTLTYTRSPEGGSVIFRMGFAL